MSLPLSAPPNFFLSNIKFYRHFPFIFAFLSFSKREKPKQQSAGINYANQQTCLPRAMIYLFTYQRTRWKGQHTSEGVWLPLADCCVLPFLFILRQPSPPPNRLTKNCSPPTRIRPTLLSSSPSSFFAYLFQMVHQPAREREGRRMGRHRSLSSFSSLALQGEL